MLVLAVTNPTFGTLVGCLSLLMFANGLFCIIKPEKAWLWGRRWQFSGEPVPSDASLCMTRVAGFLAILASLFCALIAAVAFFANS